jgi:hypothetical protein
MDCASGKVVVDAHWEHDLEADQISFSPDGSLVAITTFDRHALVEGPVYVYDAATAHLVRQIGVAGLLYCQLSHGGRFALVVHGKIVDPELIDLRTGATVQKFPAMQDCDGMALMSPDGRTILVGIKEDTIAVWRLRAAGVTTRP